MESSDVGLRKIKKNKGRKRKKADESLDVVRG